MYIYIRGFYFRYFRLLVSPGEMDREAHSPWRGTSPCDGGRTVALSTNTLQADETKSSQLVLPGARSGAGAIHLNLASPW